MKILKHQFQDFSVITKYQRTKEMINDWPYLKKYHQENAKLPKLEFGQKRIVFMGDSITEFWSTICPDFFYGKPYINRGISGQTSPQMLVRFRADVIALQPTIVVLLAGVNDIAGNTGPSTLEMITNNIFSMVELAKANQIKVILCSVLPANHFHWRTKTYPAEKIIELNILLKKYAEDNHIYYLDYHSAMADEHKGMKTALADDGLHPNKKGYEIMAPLVENAIDKVQ
jgi:lysophospholipase L1-like esterase